MTATPNYNSPELRVFKLHFSHLVEAISHPEQLADELYSQDMISKGVHDEVVKHTARSAYGQSKLICAVEDQIMVNPSILHRFLSVLRRDPSLVYLADAMSDHYQSLNDVLPTLSQLSLLPPKSANATLPTLGQLSTELRHFENWYLLGIQLAVSKDTLDSIEKTHDTQVRRCFEMIHQWISNCYNPTWEAVHDALRKIGESVLAAEIAGKYNIRPIITREEKSPAQSESSTSTELLKPQQSVCKEQRRVIGYFAVVMGRITNILESLVKPEKLLRFLRFHCHPMNPEVLYIDQDILQCTGGVSEIMKRLVPDYINYMNTELLEVIIERFECKEAQSLLQQYHDRYSTRLLQDMPNPVSDERLDMTRRKRLRPMCESDFDSTRAVDIKRIQTAIESATGIDHQFVTPSQQNEG